MQTEVCVCVCMPTHLYTQRETHSYRQYVPMETTYVGLLKVFD